MPGNSAHRLTGTIAITIPANRSVRSLNETFRVPAELQLQGEIAAVPSYVAFADGPIGPSPFSEPCVQEVVRARIGKQRRNWRNLRDSPQTVGEDSGLQIHG